MPGDPNFEAEKRYYDKNLEKYHSKNVSTTTSSERYKIKNSVTNQPRRQLKQIICEEMGRVNRPIEDELYYHGFMTRAEARKLLTKEGEFLGMLITHAMNLI